MSPSTTPPPSHAPEQSRERSPLSLPPLTAELDAAGATHDDAVGWKVAAMVLAGLFAVVLTAALGANSSSIRRPLAQAPLVEVEAYERGVEAYGEQHWDQADLAFQQVLESQPGHPRAADYRDRIERTRHDAALVAEAEQALAAGDTGRAARLAGGVSPASPMFAEAEALARSAAAAVVAGQAEPVQQAPTVDAAGPSRAELYLAGDLERACAGPAGAGGARWVQDCRKFSAKYRQFRRSSGGQEASTTRALKDLMALDRRLGGGPWADDIRTALVRAMARDARELASRGQLVGACTTAHEAAKLDRRQRQIRRLERRCNKEATSVLRRAEALETVDPKRAVKLYREAARLATPDGRTAHRASRALKELDWTQER